jgi:hypothetical protein
MLAGQSDVQQTEHFLELQDVAPSFSYQTAAKGNEIFLATFGENRGR